MEYAIYIGGSLIALFKYEGDRDVCLLALIASKPEYEYRSGIVKEGKA